VPLEVRSVFARQLILLLTAITAFVVVQGCTLAAPAAINYGVSKITEPKTAPPPAASQRTYPEYLTEMERINMEREKAGLQPRPIMTQEEWVCAQGAGRTPPALSTSPQPTPAMSVPAQSAPAPAAPAPETPGKNSEAK
jgi:hypothetical protein